MFTLLYVLARLRRPVRLLECPDRASLLRPGGLQQASRQPTAGAGAGFRRLSGRHRIVPSGDWASGNQTFALSCGSPGTPSHTPGHVLPVFWHAIFPYCPFGLRSAIRSKDTSSSPCPLRGLYSSTPRGARRSPIRARHGRHPDQAPNRMQNGGSRATVATSGCHHT